jgi:hypothetical protein
VEGDGASLVPVVVHAESAKPTASGAIKLKLDICKARRLVVRDIFGKHVVRAKAAQDGTTM